MLVALGFSHKDCAQAVQLCEWMREIGPYKAHSLVLVASSQITEPALKEMIAAAKLCDFGNLAAIRQREVEESGWPKSANALFRTAAKYAETVAKCSFLWLEPDCIPLKSGWLDALESEFKANRKPFMGFVWDTPKTHMNGCGIYPQNIAYYNQWLLAHGTLPFDLNMPQATLAHCHATKLIDRKLKDPATNTPHSFQGFASLSVISPDAVLFHGCKDGTLIRVLRDKKNGVVPVPRAGKADFVSLRRNGDIICLLPLLKELSKRQNRKQRLVVHREYMGVLDGVSYVEGIPWDGDQEDPLVAAEAFDAVNAQVYGKRLNPDMKNWNYAKCAWHQAGYVWNRHLPLVFDRRNPHRESKLRKSVFKTDKPKILVNLNSLSSPFAEREFVMSGLASSFRDCEIVVLDNLRAERIYDLLGLMDYAQCLVTADTSPLWLAHASAIPVVAFHNPSSWGASPARGNTLLRLPYNEVRQKFGSVIDTIKTTFCKPENEQIVLVYQNWIPTNPTERKRVMDAMATWKLLKSRMLAFTPGRTSASLGDNRNIAYVRDLIEAAMQTGDESIIALTNNDIAFDPRLAKAVRASVQKCGCYWSYRLPCPGGKTDEGADFFAFTRCWWRQHQHQFPDFLLGYYWWDDILIRLMRWSGCVEGERLHYHTPHPGTQERLERPGMKYNVGIAHQWLKQYDESYEKPLSGMRDWIL